MAKMTGPAKQSASQDCVEAPPPYTEASSNVLPFEPAPSTVGHLDSRCSANATSSHFVDSKAAFLQISSQVLRDSPPRERRRLSEDSATRSNVAQIFENLKADVPPGVHLVQTPYKFRRKNTSIIREFLIFKGGSTNTFLPDIRLRTKNALLQSAVYINPEEWGRPVSVHARTKNADLILGIHTLQADQAVRVRASTKNGRNRTFLPRDFKGLLAVSTKNGRCTLSADLRKRAVRVPSRYIEKLEDDELFGDCSSSDCIDSDVPDNLGNGVDVWYEINGGGPSGVTIDTKNGNVWVGFVQDEDEEVSCWTGCSVM